MADILAFMSPTIVIILGVFILFVLFIFSMKPVDNEPPANNEEDIKNLMKKGKKITAIKEYRRLYGSSLTEAKEAVENLVTENDFPDGTSEQLKEIQRLVNRGEKIAAIKAYRQLFNVGLKEAKESVELLEKNN